MRLCVPYDEHYDGLLCGLPVACFTTTLWDGELPDTSPYPRNAKEGTEHWRVSVPFDLADYEIFLMHKVDKQVQLLCLDNKEPFEFEAKLMRRVQDRKLTKRDFIKFFPGGKPNDYMESNFFVNVHFVAPVPLMFIWGKTWSPVRKRNSYGYTVTDKYHENLREKWIKRY